MALTTSITLAGNLTKDPELRQTSAGKPVVNVSIAVNPRTFDREKKEWVDGEPVYWRGSAYGDMAEHIAHSLSTGNRVIAHGTIKASSWVDKDSGTKRTEKEFQIEEIGPSLLFSNATPTREAPKREAQSQDEWANNGFGDDTPF